MTQTDGEKSAYLKDVSMDQKFILSNGCLSLIWKACLMC